MRWHGVWSDITATSFRETGDVGGAKGTLKRVLTVSDTRQSEIAGFIASTLRF